MSDHTVFFRSLEESDAAMGRSPAATAVEPGEFSQDADQPAADFSRRGFLGMLAASAALAGLAGCRKPYQKILPYTRKPEDMIPGIPRWYASAHLANGYGYGIIVKSHEGRPTKIEGNPSHPGSLGATDLHAQAELLQLYDPARSKVARLK